mgnify:CR=1 FL=1
MSEQERIMVTLSADGGYVKLHTFSRRHGRSRTFYIPEDQFGRKPQAKRFLAADGQDFVQVRIEPLAPDEKLTLEFAWLSCFGQDGLRGRSERAELDCAAFYKAAEQSRTRKGEPRRLLSRRPAPAPRVWFESRKNLRETVQKPILRKKLGRFLTANFQWKDCKGIRILDDFVPYSFCFEEHTAQGIGIFGGIILHGQEDLRTAYYGMHT